MTGWIAIIVFGGAVALLACLLSSFADPVLGLLFLIIGAALMSSGWYGIGQHDKTLPHRANVACSGSTLTLRFSDPRIDYGLVDRYQQALQKDAHCQVALRITAPGVNYLIKPTNQSK